MTAHDPRVKLTEAERTRLRLDWPHASDGSIACMCLDCQGMLMRAVEQIIAARLAPIRALADEWERNYSHMLIAGFSGCSIGADSAAKRLRAALEVTG